MSNRAFYLGAALSCMLAAAGAAVEPNAAIIAAYYPLDGRANDTSGNELHGMQMSVTAVTNRFGATNSALAFDGATSYIDCGNPPQFNFQESFTLAAWVRLNGAQPEKYVIAKHADYGGGDRAPRSFGLGLSTDGRRAYGFIIGDSSTYWEVNGSKILNDGSWHHIALVYDRTAGLRIYADGAQEGVRTVGQLPKPMTNSIPLTIGRAATGQAFAGQIDDVHIFSTALSTAEVLGLTRTLVNLEIKASRAVKLELSTTPGQRYQLEYSDSLAGWQQIGPVFLAATTNTVRYVDATDLATFFRYLQVP